VNRRRRLIVALGAGTFSAPLGALAQQMRSIPVVAVLNLDAAHRVESLRQGLRELGYVEGRNVRLETRNPGDRYARLPQIASEFVQLKVDVIVTFGSTATLTASKVTSTIPIVMVAGVDPVKEKLPASLGRPGGNVTGVATILQDLSAKRLELAKEAFAGLTAVGVLWNSESRTSALALVDTQEAAKRLGLQLHAVEIRAAADFSKAFETLARNRITVFVLLNSNMFVANRPQLLESAARNRLVGVFAGSGWIDHASALLSYGTNPSADDRQAAVYVDKILKGAKPGDLPIEQPTTFELIVNVKTAKALGIKIPQSILVRADKVIQ